MIQQPFKRGFVVCAKGVKLGAPTRCGVFGDKAAIGVADDAERRVSVDPMHQTLARHGVLDDGDETAMGKVCDQAAVGIAQGDGLGIPAFQHDHALGHGDRGLGLAHGRAARDGGQRPIALQDGLAARGRQALVGLQEVKFHWRCQQGIQNLSDAEAAAASDDTPPTLDSNGAVLNAGDTVVIIKDLNVKGTSFVAKRGTAVRNISLTNNPEHIEGRVNGTRIVILTCFVKKS